MASQHRSETCSTPPARQCLEGTLGAADALRALSDAVITADAAGLVTYLNPAAEQLTGWTCREARGCRLDAVVVLVTEESRQTVHAMPLRGTINPPGPQDGLVLTRRDGTEIAVSGSASPVRSDAGAHVGTVVAFRDDRDMRKFTQQLAYQAAHDPLTGLVNRREFERRLSLLMADACDDVAHSIIFRDVDRFKAVNDRGGHAAGDALLTLLGATMSRRLRAEDTLARLGGDEFAVLLPRCARADSERIAHRICVDIAALRFTWRNTTFSVGASIGLLPLTSRVGPLADVVRAVDTACYLAKQRGGNRVIMGTVLRPYASDRAPTSREPHRIAGQQHA